jgi:hypothetical protein
MGMNGLLFAERNHMARARLALKAAGAAPRDEATVNSPYDPEVLTAKVWPRQLRPDEISTVRASNHPTSAADEGVVEIITAALGKRESGHQALMDVAHNCVGRLTDGVFCATAKAGARHSQETMERLASAHDHLVAAGAECASAGFVPEVEWQGAEFEAGKAAAGDLAKMLAGEREEKTALIATLSDIVPRLNELTKRVDDIARTPLPPLAMSKSVTAISKQQDSGAGACGLSPEDLAAAFSRMSKEDQTLTLIRASHANPIHPPGLAAAKEPRGE